MDNAYLVAGLRTPIGGFGKSLARFRATELAALVADQLLLSFSVKPDVFDLVVAGMVLQDMTESNPARIVSEKIGLSHTTPAFTINMQCCSGMMAAIQCAQQVALGTADCAMAIGLESMSNAPHMVEGSRWGLRLSHGQFIDTLIECTLAGSKMWNDPRYMIDVAENHAKIDQIGRAEMDEYAVVSHRRALDAIDHDRLSAEIVPIEVVGKNGAMRMFDKDEHPRRDIDASSLSELRAVRDGGVITAGNAAGINDGAAVAIICNEQGLSKLGLDPLARIPLDGIAMVGCDPSLMGYSCVDALTLSLQNAQLTVDDLDLIECNEGFAVQLLACERMGKWPRERLNVDGGSVGLGHPVGMSGLRIVNHLAYALRDRQLKKGAATVPAGSGLGTALLLERV